MAKYSHGYEIRKGTWQDARLKMIGWKYFKEKRVLDIGCAHGILSMQAKKYGASYVEGCDIKGILETAKVEANRLNLDINFRDVNVESEKFKSESLMFDITFFCSILNHMKDKVAMVQWIDRHTRKKLFCETNYRNDKDKFIQFMKKYTSFAKYTYRGDSGDIPNTYHLFECSRNAGDSIIDQFEDISVQMIDIEKIVYRDNYNKLSDCTCAYISSLAENIKRNGMVCPLAVIKSIKKEGFYNVWEGGHRFWAAKLLNYNQIPCKVVKKERR